MERNTGESIQGFALVLGIAGVVFSIISGIIIMVAGVSVKGAVAFGLVSMIMGILVSLASYKLMYGFGIIVSNNEMQISQNKKTNAKELGKQAKEELVDTKVDDESYIDILCPYCEERISYTKKEFVENESLTCPECYEVFDTKLFK